jgi:hypothetical protein
VTLENSGYTKATLLNALPTVLTCVGSSVTSVGDIVGDIVGSSVMKVGDTVGNYVQKKTHRGMRNN